MDERPPADPTSYLPPPPAVPPSIVSTTPEGRALSPDGRFWWSGQAWVPYTKITWNSLNLRTNPPEDAAKLAFNLGIWAVVLGALSILLGCISLMALVAGIVSIVNFGRFQSENRRYGGQLPGASHATIGLVLSVIGLAFFLFWLVVGIVLRTLR